MAFPRLPRVLAANLCFRHQKSRKSRIPRFCACSQKDLLRKRYGSGRPDFLGNSEPPTMRGPAPAEVAKSATVLYKTISCSAFISRWARRNSKRSQSVIQKHILLLFEDMPRVKKKGEYCTKWLPGGNNTLVDVFEVAKNARVLFKNSSWPKLSKIQEWKKRESIGRNRNNNKKPDLTSFVL